MGWWGGWNPWGRWTEKGAPYFVHQLLNFRPVRVFASWRCGRRDCEVDLFLRGMLYVLEEVGEVRRGLEVDFAVMGRAHCRVGLGQKYVLRYDGVMSFSCSWRFLVLVCWKSVGRVE